MPRRVHFSWLMGLLSVLWVGASGAQVAPEFQRSALIEPPRLMATLSAAQLTERLKSSDSLRLILALIGTPRCGVRLYELHYATLGGAGEPTNATGALMLPLGSDALCSSPRPALAYAHATSTRRAYNLANLEVAASQTEALLLAAVYVAQGFIVVAPNYAGYDRSTLPYHPYLNAEQQSGEMLDILLAAASVLPTLGAEFSGQLLLAGYSQGGHVAMATQRRLQTLGVPLTASSFMSGPYALAAFGDAVFYGWVSSGATLFVPLILSSFQASYGNLDADPNAFYAPAYAATVPRLLPGAAGPSELYASGALPKALFSAQAPEPGWESITPPPALPPYISAAPEAFGHPALLSNALRHAYLLDFFAQPDGLVTGSTYAGPAVAPAHPLRQALKRNDLRNFTPINPVLLCGGQADTTVFFDLNTRVMQAYWSPPSPAAMMPGLLQVLDVDSPASSDDPWRNLKQQFALLKGVARWLLGEDDLMAGYHGALLPPFCFLAARQFFQDALRSR